MPPQENTTPITTPTQSRNTTMAVLSYLGILVLIPLFTAKDDPFVKFHIKQGLVLFCIEVIMQILIHMVWSLWGLFQIVNLAVFILSVIGIINAYKGNEKELPVVGGLASNFKF